MQIPPRNIHLGLFMTYLGCQSNTWIWQHGIQIIHNGKPHWRCRLCRHNPKQYACGSTKHPIEHLRTHRLTERGPMEPESSNSIIRQAFGNSLPRIRFNSDVFKQLLVQWIVLCHISFRQVEQPSFCLLLSYLASISATHTSIPKSLPMSGNTVRTWTQAAQAASGPRFGRPGPPVVKTEE